MGMYTEIFFRAEVDQEAYEAMFRANEYGSYDTGTEHSRLLWAVMNTSSAYFPDLYTGAKFFHEHRFGGAFRVEFRASLKNYDEEIEKFFEWVAPHCIETNVPGGFIGYSLYEEHKRPTLFFADGTVISGQQVTLNTWKEETP